MAKSTRDIRTYIAGAKRGLAVSKRLTEAHIWLLIVNLVETIVICV